jgi:hypothetical protein
MLHCVACIVAEPKIQKLTVLDTVGASDPHLLCANLDPDPAFLTNADPDPTTGLKLAKFSQSETFYDFIKKSHLNNVFKHHFLKYASRY